MDIKHAKVSAIPDDPAAVSAGEVVPSDWNDEHVITPGPWLDPTTLTPEAIGLWLIARGLMEPAP